jgi:HipA-like protein
MGMAERILHVLLHQRPIGTLTLLAGDQSIFAFDETYILDQSRPILSLSFKAPMIRSKYCNAFSRPKFLRRKRLSYDNSQIDNHTD